MRRFATAIGLTALVFLTCVRLAGRRKTGRSRRHSGSAGARCRRPRPARPHRPRRGALARGREAPGCLDQSPRVMHCDTGRAINGGDCTLRVQSPHAAQLPPRSLHFLIGHNGSRDAGHAVGVSIKIGVGYDPRRPKETIGSDWPLVSLDKSLGSEDRILPIVSNLPEDGTNVVLGGYQQDHPLLLMVDTQCQIDGRFVDATGRLVLRRNCTGTHGVSGAPLLIDRGGIWQVAPIDVAGETGSAHGVAVVLDEAIKSSER